MQNTHYLFDHNTVTTKIWIFALSNGEKIFGVLAVQVSVLPNYNILYLGMNIQKLWILPFQHPFVVYTA